MTTYNAVHVAPDGSLQPTRRELTEPAAGHVRVKVEAAFDRMMSGAARFRMVLNVS